MLDYTQGRNTLSLYQKQFDNNPQSIEINYKLAQKHISRWDISSAHTYFQNILEFDPENKYGYKEESTGYSAAFELMTNKNDEPLLIFLNSSSSKALLTLGFRHLISFYKREKNQEKLFDAYELAFTKFPENASYMNDCAWYIYENKIKEKYEHGIRLAAKAVEIEPKKANIWDTLAWLEFEQENVDRAIQIMKKAIDLDSNREYYKNNLKIFLEKKSESL